MRKAEKKSVYCSIFKEWIEYKTLYTNTVCDQTYFFHYEYTHLSLCMWASIYVYQYAHMHISTVPLKLRLNAALLNNQ